MGTPKSPLDHVLGVLVTKEETIKCLNKIITNIDDLLDKLSADLKAMTHDVEDGGQQKAQKPSQWTDIIY